MCVISLIWRGHVHTVPSVDIRTQLWSDFTDGKNYATLLTRAVSRIGLGVPSVEADHTWDRCVYCCSAHGTLQSITDDGFIEEYESASDSTEV